MTSIDEHEHLDQARHQALKDHDRDFPPDRWARAIQAQEEERWALTPSGWNAIIDKLTPAQARAALEVYLRIEEPLLLAVLAKALEGGR